MFRNKEFLINEGIKSNLSESTYYLIGTIYDDVVEQGFNDNVYNKFNETREWLKEHSVEVLNTHSKSISQWGTIKKHLRDIGLGLDNEKSNFENISLDNLEDWMKKSGIYGIYLDNKLCYIGMTNRTFLQRYKDHLYHYKNKDTNLLIYKIMNEAVVNEGASIEMKPLIIFDLIEQEADIKLTLRDKKLMELTLIKAYKPIGNNEGIHTRYII